MDYTKKKYIQENLVPQILLTHGILCFSLSFRSPAMWGHYSNNHTGLCLGFTVNTETIPYRDFVKVKYDKKKVDFPTDDINKSLIKYKSDEWFYEKEWRGWVSLNNCKTQSADLYFLKLDEKLYLTEVIIGLRSSCSIVKIKLALKNYYKESKNLNEVKIYKAYQSENEYKIDKKYIDTFRPETPNIVTT